MVRDEQKLASDVQVEALYLSRPGTTNLVGLPIRLNPILKCGQIKKKRVNLQLCKTPDFLKRFVYWSAS